jgi:hypothetical protein
MTAPDQCCIAWKKFLPIGRRPHMTQRRSPVLAQSQLACYGDCQRRFDDQLAGAFRNAAKASHPATSRIAVVVGQPINEVGR